MTKYVKTGKMVKTIKICTGRGEAKNPPGMRTSCYLCFLSR